jgi:hypothetical protein
MKKLSLFLSIVILSSLFFFVGFYSGVNRSKPALTKEDFIKSMIALRIMDQMNQSNPNNSVVEDAPYQNHCDYKKNKKDQQI